MLPSLTSLRFFAALMVVFSHLPGDPFYEGYSGVTFFFVLSGFILSYRYSTAFRLGDVSAKEFWIGRVARIYPLHLLTMLLAFPAALQGASAAGIFLMQLTAQLTLTQAAIPLGNVYFSFDYPSWSLSVEAFFYLLFPLLVRTSTTRLTGLLALVGVYHLAVGHLDNGVHFLAYIFPPARLGDFVAGILLFRAYERVRGVRARVATTAQVGALTALAGFYALAPSVPQALRWDVFYLLPMAAVIFACAWQNGLVSRCLSFRGLVFLGDASFALYLIHQLVIRAGRWLGLGSGAASCTVYVLVSVVLAGVTYTCFETRFRLTVSRWLKGLALGSQPVLSR